jgi:hypothetical protein
MGTPRRIPRSDVTTAPLPLAARPLALAGAVAASVGILIIVVLIAADRDIDASWRFISEYELGSWGGFMSVAFLSLAVSGATLHLAIRSQIATVGGRIGLVLLVVSVIGFVLAGAFRTDAPDADAATVSGAVHSAAAVLGGFVPLAAYLIAWSLARNVAWRPYRRALWWVTTVAILANLASIAQQAIMAAGGGFGPDVPLGWPNRLFVLAMAAWMLFAALLVRTVAVRTAHNSGEESVSPAPDTAERPTTRLRS